MKEIEIRVTLTDAQAWQYAQFLKRAIFDDYRSHAMNDDEAYAMFNAGECIRRALREKGYAPR